MQRLAILGAGDLGRLVAYHAGADYEVFGFFDDAVSESTVDGLPVWGTLEDVQRAFDQSRFDVLLLGIGSKHMGARQWIYQRFSARIPFGRLIHPTCSVDPTCRLGDGCIVLPGCTLDRKAELGPNVLLGPGSVLAHDARIGGHSFTGPGVLVGGFAQVGQRCLLSIGTVLGESLRLTDEVRTGAGAVVVEDLLESGLYLGVPARKAR